MIHGLSAKRNWFLQSLLSDAAPQFLYKFIDQTLKPGPTASLKCSAAGNPTPNILWTLDGFPLPESDRYVNNLYEK